MAKLRKRFMAQAVIEMRYYSNFCVCFDCPGLRHRALFTGAATTVHTVRHAAPESMPHSNTLTNTHTKYANAVAGVERVQANNCPRVRVCEVNVRAHTL